METEVAEIAPDMFRLSTFIPEANFMFNQFLLRDDEPLLFHTGPRALFPLVSDAVSRLIEVARLRWITFGHVESDECGSMNLWLQAAPHAEIAHGAMGCIVSVNDLADRPPRPLQDGEVSSSATSGCVAWRPRTCRTAGTPACSSRSRPRTLLCGDLFTAIGASPALTEHEIIGPALAAEDVFGATCLTPSTAPTMRRLADLGPQTSRD